MNLRSASFLIPAALLGGCGLVYNYGDYKDQPTGGMSSSSTSSAGAGGTMSSASSSTSSGTGGATSTSSSSTSSSTTSSTSSSTSSTSTSSTSTSTSSSSGVMKLGNGQGCSAPGDCASNACEVTTGSSAKICCAAACSPCNLCKSDGSACTPAAARTADPGCPSGDVCDGSGNCKLALGTACSGDTACASGFCAPSGLANSTNVCCSTACNGACQACTTNGTCSDLTQYSTDSRCTPQTSPVDCTAGLCVCNGLGQCLLKPGSTCQSSGQCASGSCVAATCT